MFIFHDQLYIYSSQLNAHILTYKINYNQVDCKRSFMTLYIIWILTRKICYRKKHAEIYWKCFVKVQFLVGYAKHGAKKFWNSDFKLSVSTRASFIDVDVVKAMLEQDSYLTTLVIAETLNSAQQTMTIFER